MFAKSLVRLFLLGLFLAPLPAYGQVLHERNTINNGSAVEEAANTQAPNLPQVVQRIIKETNEFRRRHGRQPVRVNPDLTRAARYYAHYLAEHDKFSHTADGKQPWQRAEEFGYDYCIVAENIAYFYNSKGFTTEQLSDDFVHGWEKSPPHRRNMLDPDVQEVGVAVARSAKTGRYYAVQDFGRPRSAEIKFEITNRTDTTVSYTVDGKSFSIKPNYTMTHFRCRPPKLQFRWPGEKGAEGSQESQVFHPHAGTEYVIRKGPEGKFRVEQQKASPNPAKNGG